MGKLTASELTIHKKALKVDGIEWPNFVETGTYLGECIYEMEDNGKFKNLYTVELDQKTLTEAQQKRPNSKVKFHLGNSKVKLEEICKELTGNSVFWLDAHQHHVLVEGEADWENHVFSPLLEELCIINHLFFDRAIIIIDDIENFGCTSLSFISIDRCLDAIKDRMLQSYIVENKMVILLDEAEEQISKEYLSKKESLETTSKRLLAERNSLEKRRAEDGFNNQGFYRFPNPYEIR
jgi:hypothetical protein